MNPTEQAELDQLNRFINRYGKHHNTMDGVWEAYTKQVLTGVLDDCQVGYQEIDE